MRTLILSSLFTAALLAQSSPYPTTLDTNSTLYVTADNVQSTLASAMGPGDNVAFLPSACGSGSCGFAANMIATVCDVSAVVSGSVSKCTEWEHMLVTAVSGQQLTVTRGIAGTSAVSHVAGAIISGLIDSAHQSSLKSAVLELESYNAPAANIKAWGAVCDGSTDSTAAFTAAVSAGAHRIFIPAGCIVTQTTIPAVTVIGESGATNGSVLRSNATPGSVSLQASSGTVLIGPMQTQGNTCNYPTNCPLYGIFVNQSDSTQNVVSTGYATLLIHVGRTGLDTAGTNVQNHYTGDGFFGSIDTANGTAARFDLEGANGTALQTDINCSLNGGCTGGAAVAVNENPGGSGYQNTTGFAWNGNVRTAGNIFGLTHGYSSGASAFSGCVFCANMALSFGSFTGNFFGLSNAGVTKFQVASTGATTITGQLTDSVTTGSAPFVIASTTPVANLTGSVLAYKGGVQQTNAHVEFGTCTLGTSCAVTVAYTSNTSYSCSGTDQTSAAAVKAVNTSSAVVTFTGTGTDVISFVCAGN